ncbi:valine--tRNA ligase [Candidatus Kaiserbacteria bacterium CG_4_9_14_3_um_filter_50_16]|uniref:Valine--tRNA ligase n=1 Tax=Candidatus Kaiserbacteria bacterium CG08_land_8_20_14_0_20_50_21 TaxID=1974604 RepID=A0A2H0YXD6_9BACT|nr:MAG: valine--tRNA ligase [Parcubacteria group bacterium CG1_02_50_68]PIS43164.1 MAG: valine--tRNA ligase [Candidatus Kaiserbacteria bacterium CG08_land_8_20_14_0_20_50_21]PIU81871.1 MAG: valine--tRNA ligase [Candidatus Kaiserbacteria bacterium CG06_land_8_20_14_3_00_49_31]PIW96502.1 MAG: valine--tRNA ligase [Candidatus Kaiserbacteria bacterium CG_4_8_14_3_um_filter_50_23]PJA00287.1 MAG: valine--tRNA ligase [Candidatus Kaiserbacteria bacterium CG_4_10_14_0_2_um_filter_50_16]PJA94374.1 MAG: v
MPEKFLQPYNPASTETRIYAEWEKSGLFNPDECIKHGIAKADAPAYTIVLPPPNVTGRLHMGHALMIAIEDIFIRYKRMCGYRTLWLPGTDHAAIATQSVVEKQIKKDEGRNRHDLGREELLKRIGAFATGNHNTIVSQLKTMGASLDWSREAFTLDETRSRAVRAVFKQMYNAGLIYRGNRIVNWDPKGQTTISDDEIVYEERHTKLYTFRYAKDFPIHVATTRPETKVGDVAVAVHPDDARYEIFVGKEYDVVFCDVPIHIKVVADKKVDPAFGTGAVGITPAHSHIDWDIADRHQLSHEVTVINEYARMTVAGRLADKKTIDAREIVVDWLKSEGLLEKEEDAIQNVATAERTGGVIEPLPKLQWFIDVNRKIQGRGKTLKELMLNPMHSGTIQIIPEHFGKTYFHWVENLRDWCISRQIWYGHRIPVWYRGEEITVGIEPKEAGWVQDEDTLDTWFSSGLWTFSTLGWPDATVDLQNYHPTDLLETGYDILFFWVARMILMTEFTLNTIPFKAVYLHGLVRDAQGRKMSKSLGNNLDPLHISEKFGSDAARMALVVGNTPGTDMRMSEEKIKGYKHFANKLWNIARFVLENSTDWKQDAPLTEDDKVVLIELENKIFEVTKDIDEYRIYLAAEKLYHYIWHTLADGYIEYAKQALNSNDLIAKASRKKTLMILLDHTLRLLHPFMPFITEEIWSSFALLMRETSKDKQSDYDNFLMVAKWPVTIEA